MIPFEITLIIFLLIIIILSAWLSIELHFPVAFISLMCLIVMVFTDVKHKVKSKKLVIPTVTVNCENNKCDTIYTYKER